MPTCEESATTCYHYSQPSDLAKRKAEKEVWPCDYHEHEADQPIVDSNEDMEMEARVPQALGEDSKEGAMEGQTRLHHEHEVDDEKENCEEQEIVDVSEASDEWCGEEALARSLLLMASISARSAF
jgi:hypothetical protein